MHQPQLSWVTLRAALALALLAQPLPEAVRSTDARGD
jgi:hypothetical protein